MAGDEGILRAELCARLRARQADIKEAIATRVYSVADSSEINDPEYVQGLRLAASSAIDYGIASLELGERRAPPIPQLLLSQARLAARNKISFDTVLRRYAAGYMLLTEFVIEEAEAAKSSKDLRLGKLLQGQTVIFDELISEISEAYEHEVALSQPSKETRRVKKIVRLLDGERLDTSELNYDFDGQHIGIVAKGAQAFRAVCELGEKLDRQVLVVQPSQQVAWAWFAGRRPFNASDQRIFSSFSWPSAIFISHGEPAKGIAGWRLTHRQAAAALSVALRTKQPVVRYGDVALLASVLSDDLLATSLRRLYLDPLADQRDGGKALRQTLRTYFATDRNISSTATKLGISRPTVSNRLAIVENRLDRSLNAAASEMEVALALMEMDAC